MNVTIVAVGKLKERFWAEACAEYLKRLRPYARVEVVEVPDADPARCGGDTGARAKEGAAVLSRIPDRAWVIALAIEGRQRSSEGLSARLDELALAGSSEVALVIGGSVGLSPEVMARADETLSLGPITLPHNLARVVLLEQLYRAFRISRGEPYHK